MTEKLSLLEGAERILLNLVGFGIRNQGGRWAHGGQLVQAKEKGEEWRGEPGLRLPKREDCCGDPGHTLLWRSAVEDGKRM